MKSFTGIFLLFIWFGQTLGAASQMTVTEFRSEMEQFCGLRLPVIYEKGVVYKSQDMGIEIDRVVVDGNEVSFEQNNLPAFTDLETIEVDEGILIYKLGNEWDGEISLVCWQSPKGTEDFVYGAFRFSNSFRLLTVHYHSRLPSGARGKDFVYTLQTVSYEE